MPWKKHARNQSRLLRQSTSAQPLPARCSLPPNRRLPKPRRPPGTPLANGPASATPCVQHRGSATTCSRKSPPPRQRAMPHKPPGSQRETTRRPWRAAPHGNRRRAPIWTPCCNCRQWNGVHSKPISRVRAWPQQRCVRTWLRRLPRRQLRQPPRQSMQQAQRARTMVCWRSMPLPQNQPNMRLPKRYCASKLPKQRVNRQLPKLNASRLRRWTPPLSTQHATPPPSTPPPRRRNRLPTVSPKPLSRPSRSAKPRSGQNCTLASKRCNSDMPTPNRRCSRPRLAWPTSRPA